MRVRVLDGIGVGDDEVFVQVVGARQQALLIVLVLGLNQVVTSAAIVDGIWGDETPRNPKATLQIVVSRLRGALGTGNATIRCEPGGYRLVADVDDVDLTRAERLLAEGRLAQAARDPERAARLLDGALASFAEDPFEHLADLPFHASADRRVCELRAALHEARNDAYLDQGRHLEVLQSIEPLLQAERYRERLRGQQVLALVRCGRQAEALSALGRLRATLREDLGIDPSPAMQALERRVLDQDPALLQPGARVELPGEPLHPRPPAGDEQTALVAVLRGLRATAGLSSEDLAGRLGLPASFVTEYEAGARVLDLADARRVGSVFGLSLLELVSRFEGSLHPGCA